MHPHILEHQRRINESLRKSYTDQPIVDLLAQEEIDLEKGGEGSKGGKVIGHTKSGKPIYENKDAKYHKDFDKEDHIDAAEIKKKHLKDGAPYKNSMDALERSASAISHITAASKHKK